ncbi:FlxA-like family protein [Methylothermus subterraneus]
MPSTEELWRIVQQQQREIRELKAKLEAKERQEETRVQTTEAKPAEEAGEVQELKRQTSILAKELEKMRTLLVIPEEPKYKSMYGLGPAASKVYQVGRGLSIGGYGNALYTVLTDDQNGGRDQADLERVVLYTGYKFSDRILFNSEIEFEHATTGEGSEEKGEVSVEFAALDFFIDPKVNVRAGLVLMPVGFINLIHEPPFFFGNRRPEVERRIIPTTWREVGVGLFGELLPGLTYTTYAVNGLNALGFEDTGIREGRQAGSKAKAENLAWVGRLDYAVPQLPGLTVGASAYLGDSGQGEIQGAEVFTQLYEGHLQWHYRGLEFRALGAWSHIGDAGKVSRAAGEAVGREQFGWYTELGYNILPWFWPDSTQYLAPFFRYERWDTQAEVASGFKKNGKLDRSLWQFGVNYKPIPNVVIKADYRNIDADRGDLADEFNLGLGFIF